MPFDGMQQPNHLRSQPLGGRLQHGPNNGGHLRDRERGGGHLHEYQPQGAGAQREYRYDAVHYPHQPRVEDKNSPQPRSPATPTTAEAGQRQRPSLYYGTPPETPLTTPPSSSRRNLAYSAPSGPAPPPPPVYDAFGGAASLQTQQTQHQTYQAGRQQHGWSATRGRYVLPAQDQQAAQEQQQFIAQAQHAHNERRPGYDHGIQQPPGFGAQQQQQQQRPNFDGMQQRAALRSQPVGGRLGYGAGVGAQSFTLTQCSATLCLTQCSALPYALPTDCTYRAYDRWEGS